MFKWAKPKSRAFLGGKLACANNAERSENPYAGSDEHLASEWDAGWLTHAQARNTLYGPSDPDSDTSTSRRANPNSRSFRDGRVARANEIERSRNPYAGSDDKMAYQWDAGWDAQDRAYSLSPIEGFETLDGYYEKRLRSSLFYWGGFIAFIAGIVMLANDIAVGGLLAFTLTPFFFLYPLIRFLFGGKGGVVPAITTVITQEVLKHQILKAMDRASRKKQR